MTGRSAEELEEDTRVPLGHEGNDRRGRQCGRIGKVEGEPREVTLVVERVELVGLMAVWTGFPDGFSFLESLILLLAAAAVVAAAAGKGARLVLVSPR